MFAKTGAWVNRLSAGSQNVSEGAFELMARG